MIDTSDVFVYLFAFLSVFIQVFFLVTFLEKNKKIIRREEKITLDNYPTVTVIVPCYNEEKTVEKTVESLLKLDYPSDKLSIFIIDDGSKDKTWEVIQKYSNYPQIQLFKKENGGKHTALNLGLEKNQADFVGCLDADSIVDSEALKRIVTYFEDPEVMAVAPSILVNKPKNLIQKAQKAEYEMGVYNKKMLAFLNGIHVTPGPFSIFRKEVFINLGSYHKAHNTEDQEIALRMQKNGYRIEHCPDAYVYTNSPNTVKKLYRQRLRWIYGFIRNTFDYRQLLFNKKYGTIAFFTLPAGFISVFSVLILFSLLVGNLFSFIYHKILEYNTNGFNLNFSGFTFDWFYLNTHAFLFISIILYSLVIFSVVIGKKIVEGKTKFSFNIVYFMLIFSFVAPIWIIKALFNAIFSKESSWVAERNK